MADLSYLMELKAKVRPYFQHYLTEKGIVIEPGGWFRCLNPAHSDTSPSMHLIPQSDNSAAYCFSCMAHADIFIAHHWLEKAPLRGMGFVHRNLYPLLKRFGIQHEELEFSAEDIHRDRVYELYLQAAELLVADRPRTNKLLCSTFKLADTRGWNPTICKQFGVATVRNYVKFIKYLHARTGFSKEFIQNCGIIDRLFGPKLITFAIRDVRGDVVAFAARDTTKEGRGKYYITNEAHNPNFRKREAIYGLHVAKNYHTQRLDIFEGYADLLTAQQAGIRCACALGGVELSKEHVDLFTKLGFRSLNLVLDQDVAGRASMNKFIEVFGGIPGVNLTIMHLPLTAEEIAAGNKDVDYFIGKHGHQAYRKIEPLNVFDYKIKKNEPLIKEGKLDRMVFVDDMLKLILNHENKIIRGKMCKTLAEVSGVPEDDIRSEIERISTEEVDRIRLRVKRTLDLKRNPDDLAEAFDEAKQELADLGSLKDDKAKLGIEECLSNYDTIWEELDRRASGVHGWKSGYEGIDLALDGIPVPVNGGPLIGLYGGPHQGKSAILLAISYNVAKLNDNATVLYWAIDDARRDVYVRLISISTGVPMHVIRKIRPGTPEQEKKIATAREELRALIRDGRLIVKDDEVGRSRSLAERWIDRTQQTYGRPILLAIDSFHNIDIGIEARPNDGSERVKAKAISNWLKTRSLAKNFTAICTLEINKASGGQNKPTINGVNESGKIAYDFHALGAVFNHYLAHGKTDTKNTYWTNPLTGRPNPVIELDFQKNKLGKRCQIFFELDEETTQLTEHYPDGEIPELNVLDLEETQLP